MHYRSSSALTALLSVSCAVLLSEATPVAKDASGNPSIPALNRFIKLQDSSWQAPESLGDPKIEHSRLSKRAPTSGVPANKPLFLGHQRIDTEHEEFNPLNLNDLDGHLRKSQAEFQAAAQGPKNNDPVDSNVSLRERARNLVQRRNDLLTAHRTAENRLVDTQIGISNHYEDVTGWSVDELPAGAAKDPHQTNWNFVTRKINELSSAKGDHMETLAGEHRDLLAQAKRDGKSGEVMGLSKVDMSRTAKELARVARV